jgi:hypothetical protein
MKDAIHSQMPRFLWTRFSLLLANRSFLFLRMHKYRSAAKPQIREVDVGYSTEQHVMHVMNWTLDASASVLILALVIYTR